VTRVLALALAAAVLALTACAGDEATRVTLTDGECAYEGPGSVEAGSVVLEIENQRDEPGVFELVRIDPSSPPDALEAYVAAEQERIDGGGTRQGLPGFATVVVPQLEVEPGELSVLTAGLTAGEYAVLCSSGTPPTSIHATASFEAT